MQAAQPGGLPPNKNNIHKTLLTQCCQDVPVILQKPINNDPSKEKYHESEPSRLV